MDLDKLSKIKDELVSLSEDELFWVVKNTYYDLVSYYGENDHGVFYNGSYDDLQIEQATRLQQHIRTLADIFHQVQKHGNFDNNYFEDVLTDGYYSKYMSEKEKAEEYKEKADRYDDLCQ